MPDEVTLIIADDHPLFRKGVADVIRAHPELRLLGDVGDGEEALAMIRRLRPRVAILDVEMPKKTGIEVASAVRDEQLPVALVLLTMHAGSDVLQHALALGVRGYVSKESAADDIVSCVHLVASGRTYISASLAPSSNSKYGTTAPTALGDLTAAERNVLRLVARNMVTRDIAAELKISPKTVENHRSNICQKLGITGTNALIWFALEHRAAVLAD